MASDVTDLLDQVALPEIDRHSTEKAMRDLWLAGRSPGLTDAMRLRYLARLAQQIGPESLVDALLDQVETAGLASKLEFERAGAAVRSALEQKGHDV